MTEQTFTESTDFEFKLMDSDTWEEKMADVRKSGMEKAAALRQEGRAFHVEILGSKEVNSAQSRPPRCRHDGF